MGPPLLSLPPRTQDVHHTFPPTPPSKPKPGGPPSNFVVQHDNRFVGVVYSYNLRPQDIKKDHEQTMRSADNKSKEQNKKRLRRLLFVLGWCARVKPSPINDLPLFISCAQ